MVADIEHPPPFSKSLHPSQWYVTKNRLDVEFVKKITLQMVIGQQMKEEELDQNY